MPYTDFHYTPTGTGVISGKEVLEQTEDAINDLGGQISGDVQTAIDTANNALNTANTASADAQNAVNTANTAHTAATNAQNTANAAQNTASNALTAAQNAQNDVNALGNRVTTAEGNITQNTNAITGLTTRMGTAEGNITTLQNDVITAQGTATSAQNTATLARGQAYVFRYSSTALTASSTNSNTLLDNTDNLKVGDKVIDSSGVLFSITAIDTQNSTFTIGTALIDLAQDSDVVHKSGDETVAGYKVFENICLSNSIKAINLENQTIDLNNCYSSFGLPQSGNISFYFCNTNDGTANISNLPEQRAFFLISQSIRILSSGSVVYAKQTLVSSNGKTFVRYCNNSVWDSWQNVTNLVTTDTNQTISGNKTFSSINGVEPSSLSLPSGNFSDVIDISSYLTYLDGTNNTYVAPANGWISITMNGCSGIQAYINGLWGNQVVRPSVGTVRFLMPVVKNLTLNILIFGGTIDNARFIPCQGNV